jgi:hypothetical protein
MQQFCSGKLVQVEFPQSEFNIRMVSYVYMYSYMQGSPVEIQTPNALEPDQLQLDSPAICVIT